MNRATGEAQLEELYWKSSSAGQSGCSSLHLRVDMQAHYRSAGQSVGRSASHSVGQNAGNRMLLGQSWYNVPLPLLSTVNRPILHRALIVEASSSQAIL